MQAVKHFVLGQGTGSAVVQLCMQPNGSCCACLHKDGFLAVWDIAASVRNPLLLSVARWVHLLC
jgi:hypothetical protein